MFQLEGFPQNITKCYLNCESVYEFKKTAMFVDLISSSGRSSSSGSSSSMDLLTLLRVD